ncbi:MAG: hypothetical protein LBD46_08550 [Endomicrobium sp.]|jgi:hypothetical protein|nr:hypothetical protein [Endomicrobium sp.]
MLTSEQLKNINTITWEKLYPGIFARWQADNGIEMCQRRYDYVEALIQNEDFIKNFGSCESKKLRAFYTKEAYTLYCEAYDRAKEDLKEENDKLIQAKFKEYNFNTTQNVIKYVKAVKTILYHAEEQTYEDSVIKLTSWLQWLRHGLSADRKLKIDSSALFFYSAIGGTGKSEILHAFAAACEELGVSRDYISTDDISSQFSPLVIKEINVAIIEDANFFGYGNDFNTSKFNTLIDRSKMSFRQMFQDMYTIKTNLSILGASNQRLLNRRISIIPIKEEEIDIKTGNVPTPEKIKQAWINAINYCPDPHVKFIDIKVLNQRTPNYISDNMMKIYDFVVGNADDQISETKGVRQIIKHVCGKKDENSRLRKFILNDLEFFISNGIAEKIEPRTNTALGLSRVKFDLEKFRAFMSGDETATKQDNKSIEQMIIEKYLQDVSLDFAEEAKKIEAQMKIIHDKIKAAEASSKFKSESAREKHIVKLNLEKVDLACKLENLKSFSDVVKKCKPPG